MIIAFALVLILSHGSLCDTDSFAPAQVAPDQVSHMDGLIPGSIALLNLMRGKAYVGVYLNSGGYLNALKTLVKKDFKEFERQFQEALTADGQKLHECMKGGTYQEKLDFAWDAYAETKLKDRGFTERFKRAYVELDEFEMFVGSMSVFHFGARYPCFVPLEKMPMGAWHLRWHLYVGNMQVPVTEAIEDDPEFLRQCEGKVVTDEPVEQNTINLLDPPAQYHGLRTALGRLP